MNTLKYIRRITTNPKIRGFLSMSSATVFAQGLTIAVLPLLARLYTPADFGVLSLVLAISAIVSPGVALRFEGAILLPASRRETRVLVSLSLLSVVVVSSVWAVFADLVAGVVFQGQAVEFLSFWVFATTFLTGLFAIFSQVAIRERKYRDIAVRSIYQSVATSASQAGLGAISWGSVGLLSGSLIGRIAGLLTLVVNGRRLIARHRWRELGDSLREFWRFPVVFAPSALLNSLALQLPLIVVAAVYGLEFAGQLGMAERIVAIPITVVGAAIGQVFIAELSQLRRSGSRDYVPLFVRLSSALAIIAAIAVGSLLVVADWLIPAFLGEDWTPSVHLVQIIAVTGAIRLIASPLSGAITLFQQAGANIAIDAIRATLMALAIFFMFKLSLTPDLAIWMIYGSLGVVYLITWVYVFVLLKKQSKTTQSKQ